MWCSRLDALNCYVRANCSATQSFPRKCLTVKRSALEIRRLVVIARSHMYWILKDQRSVCTPCYASYVSRLVVGQQYQGLFKHVAVRLQAVLIRKEYPSHQDSHVCHVFLCFPVTALAVLTRDWRDSYFLNCDNKIRVEYEEYLSSHSFSPVSGIGQSPSLIERVSFGLLED